MILSLWLIPGMGRGAPDLSPGQAENRYADVRQTHSMVLAEDEGRPVAGRADSESGTDGEASEPAAGQKPDTGGQSASPKTAPLKPFTPSEEIPAEQAVDFPVDI